jgi:hypothetical protein
MAPFTSLTHRLGPGLAVALLLAFVSGGVASAKGPDFFGPMRIRLVGSNGARAFDASSGPDQEAKYQLTQQVVAAVAAPAAGTVPSDAGDYYEILFEQQPGAMTRLPWYGMPVARFFYHPGHGTSPAYLRIAVARQSEPMHETWELVSRDGGDLFARHLSGLAPIRVTRPAPAPNPMLSWLPPSVALVLAGSLLLVARTTRGHPAVAGLRLCASRS